MGKKKLSEYRINDSNPRFISQDKLERLKKSINGFPKMMSVRPIVVDDNNVVLGGNMRFRALQELGYTEVDSEWIKQITELTDEQKKEFIIKDNVGFGYWDWEVLSNEWNVDDLSNWGLEVPESSGGDVDMINSGDETSEWVGMPEFEESEDEFKVIIYFTSEKERDFFVNEKSIEITKKQNNQWISRI